MNTKRGTRATSSESSSMSKQAEDVTPSEKTNNQGVSCITQSLQNAGITRDALMRIHGVGSSPSTKGGDPSTHAAQGMKGEGGAFPHQKTIQESFGDAYDLSALKAHTGADAKQATDAMRVGAYASNNQAAFGSSSPSLHTAAHEAAHLVQQHHGVSLQGGVSLPGDVYEKHANAVADAVVAGESAKPLLDTFLEKSNGNDTDSVAIEGDPQTKAIQADKGLQAYVLAHDDVEAWMNHESTAGTPEVCVLFNTFIRTLIEYENSSDGRPSANLTHVRGVLEALQLWQLAKMNDLGDGMGDFLENLSEERSPYNQIKNLLQAQVATHQGEVERLARYTADADAPYQQMTDEGLLWNVDEHAANTERVGETGRAYFNTLSHMNMETTMIEAAQIAADATDGALPSELFAELVIRTETAIRACVVNHYTPLSRANMMLEGGGMLSKTRLTRDVAQFKDNSQEFDSHALANNGFVFFFIEHADAPLRGSRFTDESSGETPARISIPIEESGLFTDGWIMLNDFAQREYPEITNTPDNTAHHSHLRTRPESHHRTGEDRDHVTRSFRLGEPEDLMQSIVDRNAKRDLLPEKQRSAFSSIYDATRYEEGTHLSYDGPDAEAPITYNERFFNNVLVGSDIAKGLATRAALEVSRIHRANRAQGLRMAALEGEDLIRLIFKDFFRPQVMIPNHVAITEEHVQT